MQVFINGKFLAAEEATVSPFDRGFLYGDGCFETIRVRRQKPAFWEQHLHRLSRTVKALAIPFTVDSKALAQVAQRLIQVNEIQEAVLRIQVTRGRGERGYAIQGANSPTLLVSLHPLPPAAIAMQGSWCLKKSSEILSASGSLGRYKTSNKLVQVMGKAEAEELGVDDVLFTTGADQVGETSSANIFGFDGDTLVTPNSESNILLGITRAVVLEIWQSSGRPALETNLSYRDLLHLESLFLTQSVWGIIGVTRLDEKAYPRDPRIDWIRNELESRIASAPFPLAP